MTAIDTSLAQSAATLQRFTGQDLTATLAKLERAIKGRTVVDVPDFLIEHQIGSSTLSAAATLKRLAGQINVMIHATGILACLPHILEDGETVEYVSLGAGNTGRPFDLETNRQIAEFKFISWQGGPEAIRQNGLFKDVYQLAETETSKRKVMYVMGTHYPLKFLNGGRAIGSVLSRHNKLAKEFSDKHGDQYVRVREWYRDYGHKVEIVDMSVWVPELASIDADEAE